LDESARQFEISHMRDDVLNQLKVSASVPLSKTGRLRSLSAKSISLNSPFKVNLPLLMVLVFGWTPFRSQVGRALAGGQEEEEEEAAAGREDMVDGANFLSANSMAALEIIGELRQGAARSWQGPPPPGKNADVILKGRA
jgi:hypothetical protein